MSVRLGLGGYAVRHDRALPAVVVQLEGRGPGLHHGGDRGERRLVHRDRGLENGGFILTPGQEPGSPGHLVQVVVGPVSMEIEQGVARRPAAVAVLGQGGAHHGVTLFMAGGVGQGGSGSGLHARERPRRGGRDDGVVG